MRAIVTRGSVLAMLALGVLTGCDQQGFSGRNAEWDRRNAGPYYVVSADPDRAVVSALGRQVAIAPAKGFCVAEDSLETTGKSAFALIGDCVLEEGGENGPRDARGALQLPKGVPGIITVSISGDPGFGTGQTFRDNLDSFIDSSEGKRLLGRSGGASEVEVLEQQYIGDAVYVLVEDGGDPLVPVLEPRFWRAFTALNDRLAVITVSGFKLLPLGKDAMLAHLVTQVETLAEANLAPIYQEPDTRLARVDRREPAALPVSELEPESIIVVSASTPSDEEEVAGADGAVPDGSATDVPVPPARPGAVDAGPETPPAPSDPVVAAAPTPEPPAVTATLNAPVEAPEAPPRPSRTGV